MKKRTAFSGILSFMALALFVSCGSTMSLPEYLGHLDAGEYKPCIAELEKRNAQDSNNDRIRDNFDIAMMKHYQKDYDSSLSILNDRSE